MKLTNQYGEYVDAVECKKPKMSHHRGSTWDCTYIHVNNERYNAWLDTTWGMNYYLDYGGKWYRISMDRSDPYQHEYFTH